MLKQKGQLIRLLHYLKPYKLIIIIGHILLFMSAGLSMIFPWIVKDIFDTIIRESQWRKLKILILVLIIVFLLRAVVSFLRNYIFSSLAEKITRDLRIDIYNSLIKLSLDYFENHELGDIVSRMTNDLNLVKETMTRGLAALVRQIFVLIIGAVILSRMDYKLTIIIFIVLPLIIFSGNKLGKKIKMISRKVQNRLGLLTSFIEQSLDGINIVKAFLLENYVTGEFELQSEKLMNKSISGIKIKSGLSSLIMFLNSFSILIVMGYGGMRVMQGILTPGELIAFILYVETITGPISTLTILYAELQRTFAAASRIFEIQDTRPGVEEKKNSKKLTQNSSATLEFQNVTFSYTKDDKILKDINFKIKTGEKVALVGPSGAGKSTIAKLLPRFYDIKCGKILIDGINIKNIALTSLRKKIGIVYQDPS
ncbi:MAG: ABC transporter ATP-binding protein, partial [Bacillota bacterium]